MCSIINLPRKKLEMKIIVRRYAMQPAGLDNVFVFIKTACALIKNNNCLLAIMF